MTYILESCGFNLYVFILGGGLTVLSWNSLYKQSGLTLKKSLVLARDGIKGLCHGPCAQSFGFGSVSSNPGRPPELGIANDLEHWILLLLPLCCWVMTINTTPDRTEAVEQNEART